MEIRKCRQILGLDFVISVISGKRTPVERVRRRCIQVSSSRAEVPGRSLAAKSTCLKSTACTLKYGSPHPLLIIILKSISVQNFPLPKIHRQHNQLQIQY